MSDTVHATVAPNGVPQPRRPAGGLPRSMPPLRHDRLPVLLRRLGQEKTAGPRTVVVPQGVGAGAAAGILLTGWAVRFTSFPDGRRQIQEVLLPGDLLGLENLVFERAEHGVQTVTMATYLAVEPERLLEALARSSALATRLIGSLLREQRRLNKHLSYLGRCSAEERMARFFLDIYKRLTARGLAPRGSFPLPLYQQEIGDHLGLTIVHVNRVLRRLREQGIVALRQHQVTIGDFERLCATAALSTGAALSTTAPLSTGAEVTTAPT
jgi:CRP-like cAMP-binding protein